MDKPWQVLLHLGMTPAPALDAAARVLDVTSRASLAGVVTGDAVLNAFTSSGLTAADVRSKTALVIDTRDADLVALTRHALITYAAATGFCGRRIDVVVDGVHLDAPALHATVSRCEATRPDPVPPLVTIGSQFPDCPAVTVSSTQPNPLDAGLIRYARRARMDAPANPLIALGQLIVIAGLRLREQGDRFPALGTGAVVDDVVDLDALRRHASTLRRAVAAGEEVLAEPATPGARITRLRAAAAADLAAVMAALGARQDDKSGDWHCPRPERHTNGDRNASMKVARGRTRCYRCDADRIDALRLVMDCRNLGPDEAARWIESAVGLGDPDAVPAE